MGRVWLPNANSASGDRGDEADVPPHRQVVHERDDARAGDVERRSRSAIRMPIVIQMAFRTPDVSTFWIDPPKSGLRIVAQR